MRGIYVLVIEASDIARVSPGVLVHSSLKPGYYVYIGSALGPGVKAVENRIRRHLSKQKKRFWHIDYLLAKNEVRIKGVFAAETPRRMECDLANALRKMGLVNAIPGFGSSDCRCPSHLLSFEGKVKPGLCRQILLEAFRRIHLDPYPMSLCWPENSHRRLYVDGS